MDESLVSCPFSFKIIASWKKVGSIFNAPSYSVLVKVELQRYFCVKRRRTRVKFEVKIRQCLWRVEYVNFHPSVNKYLELLSSGRKVVYIQR